MLGTSLTSRVHAFGASDRTLTLRSGNTIPCRELSRLDELKVGPHLLVHLAFVTREHAVSQALDDYVRVNEAISSAVLRHSQRSDVAGLCLPSSGAVYNADRTLARDVASNPYGTLKVQDEERFSQFSQQPERTAIPRVFNLAGPFLNKTSAYALGSILVDLLQGGPVKLLADRPILRSYLHVRDLVDISFAVMVGLIAGPCQPFDTVGDRVIEIGELALLAGSLLGLTEVEIVRPTIQPSAIPDRYVGDGTELASLASAYGLAPASLTQQVLDTAAYLRSASG